MGENLESATEGLEPVAVEQVEVSEAVEVAVAAEPVAEPVAESAVEPVTAVVKLADKPAKKAPAKKPSSSGKPTKKPAEKADGKPAKASATKAGKPGGKPAGKPTTKAQAKKPTSPAKDEPVAEPVTEQITAEPVAADPMATFTVGGGVGVQAPSAGQDAIDRDEAKDIASTFHMLADSSRVRLLYFLAGSERPNVAELAKHIGYSQPACSHHLSLLSAAKIIRSDRAGKCNYYRLTELGRRALEAAGLFRV